jgi:hypothetical protein
MSFSKLVGPVAFVLLTFIQVLAQDQTIIVSDKPKVFTGAILANAANDTILKNTAAVKQKDAAELITNVLGTPDKDTYYIIHLVRYLDSQLAVDQQNWYVYYRAWDEKHSLFYAIQDLRLSKHFTDTRIFGSSKIALVYLHFNVPGATDTQVRTDAANEKARLAALAAPGPAAAANIKPDAIVDAIFRGGPIVPGVTVQTSDGQSLVKLDNSHAVDERFLPVSYRITVTRKLTDVQQSLKGIAEIVGQAGGVVNVKVTTSAVAIGTGRVMDIKPQPSDIKVSARVGAGDGQKELSTQTYDNERRYHINFSFALPLRSFNSLAFNTENQLITAKKIQKQDLFGMINLSPFRFDTKSPWAQAVPVLIYGVPITGKPLNQHLLGVAVGVNYVQPFIGVHFNRVEDLRNKAVGQTPSANGLVADVRHRWIGKLSFGINIPVSTVKNLLKPDKK